MRGKRHIFYFFICFILLMIITPEQLLSGTIAYDETKCNMFSNSENVESDVLSATVSDSLMVGKRNELVILVHGFARTKSDMSFLKKFFISRGYDVFDPTLPTTFRSLEECTVKFEQMFQEIDGRYDRINFVGHSIGGLIIRLFLARNTVQNIGRCVLITTPNKGTEFISGAAQYCKLYLHLFKPLKALKNGEISIPSPVNTPTPEIGAIAGNKSTFIIGRLLKRENDGRIPVDSVPFKGMKEFIVLYYNHRGIHHRQETAEMVYRFLQKGSFVVDIR